ncbi:hypothetical protein FE257_006848 [Aspergillus nanangensis]|uniref:Uncharacterized protein n=1 Tax=Aspergillus nanangensis TaxID=2582783 RepID=A0AAD4CNV5_ASPNN|nr:hypothetical protein FE257_006848 [Aspergillus nanangensis]
MAGGTLSAWTGKPYLAESGKCGRTLDVFNKDQHRPSDYPGLPGNTRQLSAVGWWLQQFVAKNMNCVRYQQWGSRGYLNDERSSQREK